MELHMDATPRFALPYILPNQAQKHVTLNASLDRLDGLTGAIVRSRQVTTQPANPAEAEAYILPGGASGGDWDAYSEGEVLVWRDGGWHQLLVSHGVRIWVEDENQMVVLLDTGWQVVTPTTVSQFGVNTIADTTNRLAVKSNAVLLSHDDVSPGSGDMRQVINRLSASHVASLIFQTNNSAGAEIGQVGSPDLDLKTSPDGSTYKTGISIRSADGKVAFPEGFASTSAVQDALALRYSFGVIADDTAATLDFGEQVFGSALLLLPNALSSGTAVFFYARLATTPGLTALFSAGHTFTISTGDLTGTTGTDGGINFSVTSDGRFIIENRRGYGVGYTAFIFK